MEGKRRDKTKKREQRVEKNLEKSAREIVKKGETGGSGENPEED